MKNIKNVAVVGATGQIGFGLAVNLLKLGHQVVAISRKYSAENSKKLDELKRQGAVIKICDDYANKSKLVDAFSGCDTVAVTIRANVQIIREVEPVILQAAKIAGVTRFIPDEFGVHTLNIDYGVGTLFDAKKDLHKQIFASGMDWTFFYNGVIFDYMLPNFRMWEKITTFGNLDIELTTHDIDDITAIAARAITDERSKNKAVQLSANRISQRKMIEMLTARWPSKIGEIEHISEDEITYLKENADPNKISAKGGFEPDQERYGINYVIYVIAKLFADNRSDTLLAQTLYPDHQFKSVEEALQDPNFVFSKH